MKLLERYLEAIRFWLPEPQQDDILNELAENIEAQAQEREAELARSLTLDEEKAILRQHGHPMRLGLRYGRQRHLIGPVLYPFFWMVLKVTLLLIGAGYVVNAIVLAVGQHPVAEVIAALFGFARAALPAFGWLVIVFMTLDWALERFKPLDRWLKNWDPASLPDVRRPKAKRQSTFEAVLGFVAEAIVAVWFLSGFHFPFLIFGPAAWVVAFSSVWYDLYPFIVLLAVVGLAGSWLKSMYAENRLGDWLKRAVSLGQLVFLFVLLNSGSLIVPANAEAPKALVGLLNTGLTIGIGIAFVVNVLKFGWDSLQAGRKLVARAERGATRGSEVR